MVLVVEIPSDVTATPSSPSGCGSHSGISQAESSRPGSGVSQTLLQNLNGHNLSLNGTPVSASGQLSRSSSVKSSNSDGSGKNESRKSHDGTDRESTVQAGKTLQSPTAPFGSNASLPTAEHPSSLSQHAFRHFINLPRATTEHNQPPDPATLGVSSPGIDSSASTLSVDDMDEDLLSDLGNSQLTTSSDAIIQPEDLPEGLRLMRVAQRRGVKVVDFAFEGLKREGVVEDWAWEGGAACKGFGIGIGGGAYNGPLKKYRPPAKEPSPEQEEDKMIIESPPPPPNIFGPKSNRPRPISMVNDTNGRVVDRPLNSPPAHPRNSNQPGTLSQSGFLQYLQEKSMASMGSQESSGFKRDRPFGSSESQENDFNPFKKRFMG